MSTATATSSVLPNPDFVKDFAFIMSLLWNEKAGRALHADDRRFPELVDLGGEA